MGVGQGAPDDPPDGSRHGSRFVLPWAELTVAVLLYLVDALVRARVTTHCRSGDDSDAR